jgi:hypothetical protein
MKNTEQQNSTEPANCGNTELAAALTSPALQWKSNRKGRAAYPANFRGRVPLKVKLAKTVTADFSNFFPNKKHIKAIKDNEYYVWVNSYGAVSAILPNGEHLGLLPSEFDVVEWHT